MRIWNYTPHAINIVEDCAFDTMTRKYMYKGGEGKYIIKHAVPSDGVLNAKIKVTPEPKRTVDGVPVYLKEVTGIDEIPEHVDEDDIVIVSALYASCYFKIFGRDKRLHTISDPVYVECADGNFKVVGCRGICEAF